MSTDQPVAAAERHAAAATGQGRVVGLDLSLTASGVATILATRSATAVSVSTVRSAGRRGDSLLQRHTRIQGIVTALQHVVHRADLVVVEGPSIVSAGGSNWDRAGLWWRVVASLCPRVPVAVVPPTTLKKWAAGKGNADKAAVAGGVTRLWPDVLPGNDNEFDALALATIGAQRLDLPVPWRAHHADVLGRVSWPDDLAAAIAAVAAERALVDEDTRFERTSDAAGTEPR